MPSSLLTFVSSTGPEPVSLREIKYHLHQVPEEDHWLVQSFITAARQVCERLIPGGKTFATTTWDWKIAGFPDGNLIRLPRPPLQSITSITYYNSSGASTTFSSTAYAVHVGTDMPGEIALLPNQAWPATDSRELPVTIRFKNGYGTAEQVPEQVKHAMRLLVADFCENRGDDQGKAGDRTMKTVELLLGSLHAGNYS